jgi:hypothetical protein
VVIPLTQQPLLTGARLVLPPGEDVEPRASVTAIGRPGRVVASALESAWVILTALSLIPGLVDCSEVSTCDWSMFSV